MNRTGKNLWLMLAVLAPATARGAEWVANSKHDLSVHSPSAVRAVDEEEKLKRDAAEHRRKHGKPLFDPEKGEYVEDVVDDYD